MYNIRLEKIQPAESILKIEEATILQSWEIVIFRPFFLKNSIPISNEFQPQIIELGAANKITREFIWPDLKIEGVVKSSKLKAYVQFFLGFKILSA